jgi:hypothetical protein
MKTVDEVEAGRVISESAGRQWKLKWLQTY